MGIIGTQPVNIEIDQNWFVAAFADFPDLVGGKFVHEIDVWKARNRVGVKAVPLGQFVAGEQLVPLAFVVRDVRVDKNTQIGAVRHSLVPAHRMNGAIILVTSVIAPVNDVISAEAGREIPNGTGDSPGVVRVDALKHGATETFDERRAICVHHLTESVRHKDRDDSVPIPLVICKRHRHGFVSGTDFLTEGEHEINP